MVGEMTTAMAAAVASAPETGSVASGPATGAETGAGTGTGIGPGIGTALVTGARAMFAADVASRTLGMELVADGPGTATVRMTVRPDMCNGHGIAHGGYVFLLADTAFACACNEAGSVTVGAGADISFIAPGRAGDELAAVAALRSKRGRSGIYDVTVTRGAGADAEVIAEFRGRSRTLPPPPTGHAASVDDAAPSDEDVSVDHAPAADGDVAVDDAAPGGAASDGDAASGRIDGAGPPVAS